MSVTMDDVDDQIAQHQWERRHELIFKLRLSALYHQKRARYYELSDKLLQAIAVLASTAAVTQLLEGDREVQLWLSGLVALVSTLLLVFTPSAKANVHINMVKDFRRVLATVYAGGEHPEDAALDGWWSECVSLEAQEPCSLTALVTECEYQLCIGKPEADKIPRPGWFKRQFMHLIDFSPAPAPR